MTEPTDPAKDAPPAGNGCVPCAVAVSVAFTILLFSLLPSFGFPAPWWAAWADLGVWVVVMGLAVLIGGRRK